jgi:hypothetical protein
LRVVLLIPDAVPLISLSRAGQLGVLLKLGCPIYIVDHVRYEVTHDKRFPDAARIETFIRDNHGAVHEFRTAVGTAAAIRREAGETQQPGQGEAAIAEFINRIDEITSNPDAPALLLFEDSDIRKSRFILPSNIHVVSTWGLLRGLERRGAIRSADDIWAAIESGGRKPSAIDIDAPGTTDGRPTSW